MARASGGWSSPKENEVSAEAPAAQLDFMGNGFGEQKNLYLSEAEVAATLHSTLERGILSGRGNTGVKSENGHSKH